jgi:primosomal protein N' (replication factor Y)
MSNWIAEVLVDVRTRALDRTFDYLVPPPLVQQIQPGQRVFVSFGRQWRQGIVWHLREATGDAAADGLKPVADVLDDEPLLTPALLDLCEWMVQRYACTRVEAVEAVLPSVFRATARRSVERLPHPPQDPDLREIWEALGVRQTLIQLERRFGPRVHRQVKALVALGAAREVAVAKDAVGSQERDVLVAAVDKDTLQRFAREKARRAPVQARIAAALAESGELSLAELGRRASDEAVQALLRSGLATLRTDPLYRRPEAAAVSAPEAVEPPPLTPWQARALARLEQTVAEGGGAAALLHGVTGSGKTELYLRLIERCLREGGGAIVLVPEIALTPQLVGRFQARFGDEVAVLHSGLASGEKRDEWLRVHQGQARVAVGARSAVFAPVRRLRLIVVDEEHEPAYKQEDAPHYDAREVALWRARREGAAVVLGSATPSLQTMYRAQRRELVFTSLPVRANGQPLPPVEVVDMREELRQGVRSILSRALRRGLEEAVESGQQAILFLNRRGVAAFVLCRSCGHVPACPHCDISLTLHREGANLVLVCHYCEYREPLAAACPACGAEALRPFGIGTQQLEDLVKSAWPSWRVLRLDVDTARRKGAHQAAVRAMLAGEVDVLIGTQMIAKGLDFPRVSFVGVVSADTMLAVPDYRAAERTFSLLAQVAGRAGRSGVPGRTVIQTYQPEHYAIQAAARHDYPSFYEHEMRIRQAFAYPPFTELTVFRAMHREERWAKAAAARFERELRRAALGPDTVVLPAVPAGIRRVHDLYRYQVVVKYLRWDDVREAVTRAFATVESRMRTVGGACVLDVNAARI